MARPIKNMQPAEATQRMRTYTVTLPESDASLFRQYAKRLGWGLSASRKNAEQTMCLDKELKTDIEQSKRDYAAGLGVTFATADEAVAYLESL